MIIYPEINNIIFSFGPIKIYWYGIFYVISFFLAWIIAYLRPYQIDQKYYKLDINDFIFHCAMGVIIGGRLGHIFLYDFNEFIHNYSLIIMIWKGGMSFHGGMIGVIISSIYFSYKTKISLLQLLDLASIMAPIGLALGRIGNFVNSELWGRVTSMPWGMISSNGGYLPRHPSQLYEAFGEGILLFFIIWIYTSRPRPVGSTSGLFLCGYGVTRFICEFFREPDAIVLYGWITIGQLLSLPMILIGCIMLIYYIKLSKKRIIT